MDLRERLLFSLVNMVLLATFVTAILTRSTIDDQSWYLYLPVGIFFCQNWSYYSDTNDLPPVTSSLCDEGIAATIDNSTLLDNGVTAITGRCISTNATLVDPGRKSHNKWYFAQAHLPVFQRDKHEAQKNEKVAPSPLITAFLDSVTSIKATAGLTSVVLPVLRCV